MREALSEGLRRWAVDSFEDGDGKYTEIAVRFGIGSASLKRQGRRVRETGEYGVCKG